MRMRGMMKMNEDGDGEGDDCEGGDDPATDLTALRQNRWNHFKNIVPSSFAYM